MTTQSLIFIGALSILGSASISGAHGTDREFGAEAEHEKYLFSEALGGGSPSFTLVVIESNSRAILRASEEGQAAVVQKRAARMSGLMKQLRLRSLQFSSSDPKRVTAAIAESIDRIKTAATNTNELALQHEITGLLDHVAAYRLFLREKVLVKRDDVPERQPK